MVKLVVTNMTLESLEEHLAEDGLYIGKELPNGTFRRANREEILEWWLAYFI